MDFGDLFGGAGTIALVSTTVPFLIIAFIIGAVVVNRQRKASSAARNWATTTGQVMAVGVQPYRSRSGSGYSTMYRSAVTYVYTVNGTQYTSDRLAIGGGLGYGSPAIAEREVAKYPAGSMVQVYYNPNNPAEAVLETRAQGSRVLWLVVVIILVILAVTTFITLNIGNFASSFMRGFGR